MKATEQFFHVALFTMLQGILTFRSVDETNQMMATEQFFHVVLFIILHMVVLALKSAFKNLSVNIHTECHRAECDYSSNSPKFIY